MVAHTTSSQMDVKDCDKLMKKCAKTDLILEDAGNYMLSMQVQRKKKLRDIKDLMRFSFCMS